MSQSQQDIFLKITDIQGESIDATHKGEIEVLRASLITSIIYFKLKSIEDII